MTINIGLSHWSGFRKVRFPGVLIITFAGLLLVAGTANAKGTTTTTYNPPPTHATSTRGGPGGTVHVGG